MLRKVRLNISSDMMSLDGIPEKRVVVLPDLETFSLALEDDDAAGYKLATHISELM